MVAVTAFILSFIVIGLCVVAAAFAGRRGPSSGPPSRGSNAVLYTGIAIICLGIGLGIPGLLVVADANNSEQDVVGGIELTAAQANGRELFTRNCATCHTLRASNAVGQTGVNLDALRPPAALVLNAILQGRARGNGNMPAGLVTGDNAKDVASYVGAVAGR